VSRSPLSYPLNRGMDMDAGGAADLQTDVMRFMAIISLCLVAIFALVQSLPAPTPTPTPPSPPVRAVPDVPPPVVRTKSDTPPPPEPRPAPVPFPEAAPVQVRLPPAAVYEAVVDTPTPPVEKPLLASPAPPVPAPAPAAVVTEEPPEEGFTLRFESDQALTRLVARNEIGLYAIQPGKAMRMSVNRGTVSFWPAGSPGQIHEMDESTVPPSVITALRRSGAAGRLKWGVTLPAKLTRDLNRFLNEHTGGALVIGGNGDLRLEQ